MKNIEAPFIWIYLNSQPLFTSLIILSMLSKAKSELAVYCIAKRIPVMIIITSVIPAKDPKFQKMSHSLRENECHKLTISEYIFIALCAQDHVILAQRFLHSL